MKPSLPTPAGGGAETVDLDEQIRAAEQAVIDGRQRAARHVEQLIVGVRGQTRRNVGIGVAVIAAVLFLARLRRRPPHGDGPRARPPAASSLALGKALSMLWQLLPGAARGALPEAVTTLVFGLLLPALGSLFRRRPRPPTASPTTESRR